MFSTWWQKRGRRQARPGVEALEDRSCPSATAVLAPDGHTLLITGGPNANTVSITQDDGNDQLVVDCDGTVTQFASSQVTTVRALLGAGKDHLEYDLAGDGKFTKVLRFDLGGHKDEVDLNLAFAGPTLVPVTLLGDFDVKIWGRGGGDEVLAFVGSAISADVAFAAILGRGNDVAAVFLSEADVGAFSDLRFRLDGNAGDDFLYWSAGNPTDSAADVEVGILSNLDVTMRGHGGKDSLVALYQGLLYGQVTLRQHGGLGADHLSIAARLLAGSTGTFDGTSAGGYGADTMVFKVIDETNGAALIQALCDGGPDQDTANTVGPVTTTSVP